MARVRRSLGWVALAVVLSLCLWAVYAALERFLESRPRFAYDRFLLHLLIVAIVVLVLGLAGVLVRNLVRLIVDRKHGILGSKLRSKIVFFFLALVLVPAVVLFYGSTAVIRLTIDTMLKPALEDATRPARELTEAWRSSLRSQAVRQARLLALEIEGGQHLRAGRWQELETQIESVRAREELQMVAVLAGARTVVRFDAGVLEGSGARRGDLVARSRAIARAAARAGEPAGAVEDLAGGLLVVASAPLAGEDGPASVVLGRYIGRSLAAPLRQLSSAEHQYRALRAQRRDLVRFYLSLTGLIFLATVFVATWIGFYLARRITGPIQELASASREISAGNLGIRVRANVGDEVGMLVEAFNEMASGLQESREVITRSTADLRRTNRALEERRRYIETLLANLSTAVLSIDRHGRVTTANPAVERILGVKPAPGDAIQAALRVEGLLPLLDLLEPGLGGRTGEVRRDLTLATQRAGALTVSVQVSPLRGSHGEDLGTLLMVEDLTDLLRAQRAAAWREVARRLAHEIKNPLTPIQLAAQRLRRKWDAGSPDVGDVLRESTASIEQEVGALKRLVDEFSRFARMPEVIPEPVQFAQVVESVIGLYRGLPQIAWEVDSDPSVGQVKVDSEQMRRALINLVENAVAAMQGKGTIRIGVRPYAGQGTLRIEVSDTGPGIPPGDRDKLFVPYFSTKRRGTGLGLAIVHRVVTDHRGTIRVEDNQPQGARFVIEIPA